MSSNDYTTPYNGAQHPLPLNEHPTAEEISAKFPNAKRSGIGWLVPCPCHDDADPSLSVYDTDRGVRVECFAGCDWKDVRRALGLDQRRNGRNGSWKEKFRIATYQHPDGREVPRYRKNYPSDFPAGPCNWYDKDKHGNKKRCGRTAPHKHIWGPSVRGCYVLAWGEDVPDNTAVVCEGEKAAAACAQHVKGLPYTAFSYGGASATSADFSPLAGRQVIIWPDADEAGGKAGEKIAQSAVEAGAAGLKLVDVSSLEDKADAADVDADTALALLEAAQDYTPPQKKENAPPSLDGTQVEERKGRGDVITTLALSKYEKDAVLRTAADKVADSGAYMALYDGFWRRNGQGWEPIEEHSMRAVLQDAAVDEMAAAMHSTIAKEALHYFDWLTRPEADRKGRIQRQDRWRNVRLDTGKLIPGAVFGDEVIWVEGEELRRRPVEQNDFILTRRPYRLPELDTGAGELFYEFLETSFPGRADERRLLMEFCGCTLLQAVDDQKFIILLGPGRSGKGASIRLLELLMGEGQSTAYSTLAELGQRFQTARLQGKGLAVIGDLGARPRGSSQRDDYLQGAALLKAITGRDAVTVERKHKEAQAVRLDVLFVAASNHPPEFLTSGADSGAWRERMLICKYPAQVDTDKRIEGIERLIVDDSGPAVAAEMIAAYLRSRVRGGYTLPGTHVAEMAALVEDAKSLADRFVEERIIYADGERVEKRILTDVLEAWTAAEGVRYSPKIRNDVYRRLRSDGCKESKGGRKKAPPYFKGLQLIGD